MTHKRYDYFKKEVSYYIVALILCFGFLVCIMQLWSATLTIPLAYGGDALGVETQIKGIIDNGWFEINPYLGKPDNYNLLDYPSNDNLNLFLMKIISYIFPNWALTLNIYFILTFPLTVVTSLFVLRKLKISSFPAIVGSLLFTFAPFHFFRGEPHISLAAYFLIPLVILVIFWIFEDNFLLSNLKKISDISFSQFLNVKSLGSIIICLGIAASFIYYPFFSCFFLLIAGVCATISRKKWSPLLNAGMLIGGIVLCLIALNLPTILYQYDYGKNMEVIIRSPAESEIFGLKVIQLLFPVPGHRIPMFADITEFYSRTSPLVNENSFASLGIIGSIGFCILILWIFYQLSTKTSIISNGALEKIQQLSILNLSAVLLATLGAFGTIFSYLISSQIRGYNRISIFIAFFCITAIVILLDLLLQKYSSSKIKKGLAIGFIVVILFVGVYDQTTENFVPNYKNTKDSFLNDKHFINNIETLYPNDTMIFQLPYHPFPESGPSNKMADYDLFRGYLHSEKIHWSFGAMKGRDGDLWQREIVNRPINEMIKGLSFAGFNGIYVDSFGYADNGKEIISSLSSILQTTPIVSDNKRLYFFDMTKYNNQLKSSFTPEEFDKQKNQFLNLLRLEWQDGFYGLERIKNNNWRWSSPQGTLIITNPSDKERTFLIDTTFYSAYPESSQLKIESAMISDNLKINSSGYHYQREIVIPPGKTIVKFSSDAKRLDSPNDRRYLVFHTDNFQISEI